MPISLEDLDFEAIEQYLDGVKNPIMCTQLIKLCGYEDVQDNSPMLSEHHDRVLKVMRILDAMIRKCPRH